jgi:hypothetical protein
MHERKSRAPFIRCGTLFHENSAACRLGTALLIPSMRATEHAVPGRNHRSPVSHSQTAALLPRGPRALPGEGGDRSFACGDQFRELVL